MNIVFAVVGLYVFARHAYDRFGYTNGALASLLFALTPPLWIWVGSGMETALVLFVTLLILVTVEQITLDLSKKVALLNVLIVAIIMSRADGFIVAAIAITYVVIRGRYRVALWASMTLIGAMVVYSTWRLSYYGDLLPNTYYAKVSGPLMEREFLIPIVGSFLPTINIPDEQNCEEKHHFSKEENPLARYPKGFLVYHRPGV